MKVTQFTILILEFSLMASCSSTSNFKIPILKIKKREFMGESIVNFRVLTLVAFHIFIVRHTFAAVEVRVHEIDNVKVHVHGTHRECTLPKNKEDIINCALIFHPSIRKGELKRESFNYLEEKASQIPNPTLSARYVGSEDSEEDVSELEANLSFSIELGGKRDSRVGFARAKINEVISSNESLKAEVKVQTILNLYRLRQVSDEKRLLSESASAFIRVIGELKKLPRLSPEQEGSLTLFEIAYEESKIQESELFEEEKKLEHFFHVATGHSINEIKSFFPKVLKRWPQLNSAKVDKPSPEVKRLNSLADLAQNELHVQRSKAWPDLKIGPSINIEKNGAVENQMIGLNLQFPIPFFQVNGGGKALAQSELSRAKKNISLTKAEESHERFEQLKIYQSAVRILESTMGQREIKAKHNRVAKLYRRGVISSSNFLNSLNQKLSYLKSRNKREITALKALWSVHKYDGKILEEKI